jgi:hypothetical protein
MRFVVYVFVGYFLYSQLSFSLPVGLNYLLLLALSRSVVGCCQHWRYCFVGSLSLVLSMLLYLSFFFNLSIPHVVLQYLVQRLPAHVVLSLASLRQQGSAWGVSRIINADSSFNLEAYKAYCPLVRGFPDSLYLSVFIV